MTITMRHRRTAIAPFIFVLLACANDAILAGRWTPSPAVRA